VVDGDDMTRYDDIILPLASQSEWRWHECYEWPWTWTGLTDRQTNRWYLLLFWMLVWNAVCLQGTQELGSITVYIIS